MNRVLTTAIAVALSATLISCASVEVRKIPDPTSYEKRLGQRLAKRRVERIKGFRYYLPRPYVVVKKTFPVAVENDFFITGTYDNRGLLVNVSPLTDEQNAVLANFGSATAQMDKSGNLKLSLNPGSILFEGPPPGGQQPPPAGGQGGTKQAGPPENDKSNAQQPAASGTNPVRLNDFFDVVHLPDFQEQYAVRTRSGLGSQKMTLNLQNGWMLTSFTEEIDNTQILKTFEKVIPLIEAIATGGLSKVAGAAGGGGGAPGQGKTLAEALAPSSQDEAASPKQSIMLRIREVSEALPGLYPILKPQEITEVPENLGDHVYVPDPHANNFHMPFTVLYKVSKRTIIEAVRITPAQAPDAGG